MKHLLSIDRAGLAMLAIALLLPACSSKKESDPLAASGIIETTDVTVSSRVAGNILRMKAHEGDRVSAGDTIAVVDDTDLRLQTAQLRAAVDVSQAQYDLARNGSRPEDIAQSDESVQQAKANLDNAEDDQRRYTELLKVGSISQKDYENVRTRYEVALRQYKAAQIGSQKLRRGTREEDIAAARARVEQARAQLAATEKKIADCAVLAPVAGVVTRKGTEEGEFVNVGTGIVTISQTETVKLKIYIAEDELGKVKLGQKADLVIDTFKDKHYIGQVTYISPTAEFTPKNVQTKDDRVKLVFEVQIEVPNRNGELKSGLTADAKLLEG
jgi:HlyD family secretion protein